MGDGIKDGAAPKAVTTYEEEESRRAFEAGNATFMRNWPYAYALGKESKIEEQVRQSRRSRASTGSEGAGVLGGYNLGISAYSKNPDGLARVHRVRHAPSRISRRSWRLKASLPADGERDLRRPGGSRRRCRSRLSW